MMAPGHRGFRLGQSAVTTPKPVQDLAAALPTGRRGVGGGNPLGVLAPNAGPTSRPGHWGRVSVLSLDAQGGRYPDGGHDLQKSIHLTYRTPMHVDELRMLDDTPVAASMASSWSGERHLIQTGRPADKREIPALGALVGRVGAHRVSSARAPITGRLRAPPVKPLDHGCVTGCRGMATRVAGSAGSGRAGTAGMSAWRHRGNNARLVTGWWCAMPERAGGAEGARVTE
jgi:hypothetical protein